MLQEGQEGALVTEICAGRTNGELVDFNNISCNTVKDFTMEYFNFHEKRNITKSLISKESTTYLHCGLSNAHIM